MIGQTIDKYTLLDEVGQGGMAVVYKAQDTKLQRHVAIKVLLPHLQKQQEAVRRFQREAVTVASLHHPNIIDIYDYSGEGSSLPYIVTELIEGQTLAEFIRKNGSLPCELVSCIAREISLALAHAHQQGIIHRDLKPENIMIRNDGKIKLMDFGIARVLESATMTLTGSIMGSPAFMSPEQILGKPVDARSDLFSLGSILYFMATGKVAFDGQNPHQILKRVAEGDFEPPQMVQPALSNAFARLVEQLLRADPDARPASAEAVITELERILSRAHIEAPSEEMHKLFADPVTYKRLFIARLITMLERRAARLRIRRPAIAMQIYNRLLAIDPNHVEANRQLDKLIKRRAAGQRMRIELVVGGILLVLAILWAWWTDTYQPENTLADKLFDIPPEDLASFPPPVTDGDDDGDGAQLARRDNGESEKEQQPKHANGHSTPQMRISPNTTRAQRTEDAKKPNPIAKDASGQLKVVALPWADIYVNGVKVGTSPHTEPFVLKPGKNIIRLENPRYVAYTRTIEVTRKNQQELIRHRMEKLPALLKLNNDQKAMVFIDGEFIGYSPLQKPIPIKLDEQESQRTVLISLTRKNYVPTNRRITVKPGETQDVTLVLRKKVEP